MQTIAGLIGILLVGVALSDTFQTVILPRRVSGVTVSKIFYQITWKPWAALGRRMPLGELRESFLSTYGPISLLVLIVLWGGMLIVGFSLILWVAGFSTSLTGPQHLYVSGTTFTTLGIGDFTPKTDLSRFITVVEAGTGFGFLAIVISYLPVLYQGFSRRETEISMLDEWAGSPPSAGELFRRAARFDAIDELRPLLARWELWTAELLESHLSYQVLSYFRSQHENQSWVASLTAIMDFATLWQAAKAEGKTWQARRVYAIGRHALGDLSQVLRAAPKFDMPNRLSEGELEAIHSQLVQAGMDVDIDSFRDRLSSLRRGYEPYAFALSHELLMDLPPWIPLDVRRDNWETTAWEGSAPGESLH
ncbi:MAG: two pore domain potassium channel family protein [Chloroflexi bacterium]|nr:MAG: two pore domain potassium channel family protein [Chloroflexota bacterium]